MAAWIWILRVVLGDGAGMVGSTGWANWRARRPPGVLSQLSSLLRQESGLLLSKRAQTCQILLSGWLRAVATHHLGSEFAALSSQVAADLSPGSPDAYNPHRAAHQL